MKEYLRAASPSVLQSITVNSAGTWVTPEGTIDSATSGARNPQSKSFEPDDAISEMVDRIERLEALVQELQTPDEYALGYGSWHSSIPELVHSIYGNRRNDRAQEIVEALYCRKRLPTRTLRVSLPACSKPKWKEEADG